MKCPVCEEQRLKSTISTGGVMTTLMAYPRYYDENGKLHHHDNNRQTTEGVCSKGHKFLYQYENSC